MISTGCSFLMEINASLTTSGCASKKILRKFNLQFLKSLAMITYAFCHEIWAYEGKLF